MSIGSAGRLEIPSREWLYAARRRWRSPTFSNARIALDKFCGEFHAQPPKVPKSQAGFYHSYFCPDHAVQLEFDAMVETSHRCPIDGRIFSGEPYDSAWLWFVNDRLSDAALRLALRAALQPSARTTGQDRVGAQAILGAYADCYPTLRRRFRHPDGHDGIATFHALDESVWVIRLAWAFALLGSAIPRKQRSRICNRLFAPASMHLWRVRWPAISNISVWNDAALIVLAIVLGDDDALHRAIDGPLGLAEQLTRGVRADGLWFEVSLSYHFYTLAAALWSVLTLRAANVAFAGEDVLCRMFHAPLGIAFPDLSLPAINDCWYGISLIGDVGHGIPAAHGMYEAAFGLFGDPEFAWVLVQNDHRGRSSSLEGLMGGTTRPVRAEFAEAPQSRPDQARASGLAVLRGVSQTGELTAILRAGPSGGGHSHPDQLSLQLFGSEARLLDDLGTPGYGIAITDDWYCTTAAHNTFVVDGVSQPIIDGVLTDVHEGADWQFARGVARWEGLVSGPYGGVRAVRQIVLADGYLVDLVDVFSDIARTIDCVYLPHGKRVSPPLSTRTRRSPARIGSRAGYHVMRDVEKLGNSSPYWCWHHESGATLDVFLAPPPYGVTEVQFAGSAPGSMASQQLSVLVRRQITSHARFGALLMPRLGDSGQALGFSADWKSDSDSPDAMGLTVRGPNVITTWSLDQRLPSRAIRSR